jgi:hypothetical protein
MDNKNGQKELSIELKDDVARGTYSNLAVITHSSSEFIIDFVCMMPGVPKAPVVSRIILTPEHAKRLQLALQDNVMKFETSHGQIEVEGSNSMPSIPMNFGGKPVMA